MAALAGQCLAQMWKVDLELASEQEATHEWGHRWRLWTELDKRWSDVPWNLHLPPATIVIEATEQLLALLTPRAPAKLLAEMKPALAMIFFDLASINPDTFWLPADSDQISQKSSALAPDEKSHHRRTDRAAVQLPSKVFSDGDHQLGLETLAAFLELVVSDIEGPNPRMNDGVRLDKRRVPDRQSRWSLALALKWDYQASKGLLFAPNPSEPIVAGAIIVGSDRKPSDDFVAWRLQRLHGWLKDGASGLVTRKGRVPGSPFDYVQLWAGTDMILHCPDWFYRYSF